MPFTLLDGLIDWSVWTLVVYFLVTTHLTLIPVTLYLHRCQAHRALELHPLVTHPFRFWLWLTTGMGTKEWVAVHRKHHAFVETEGDPHSPMVHGIRKVMLEGTELYQQAARDPEVLKRYGFGTPDDFMERHVYSHRYLGIGLYLLLAVALFGPIGITIWAFQMMWIPFIAAGVINGIGHYWGYRNYDEVADTSRNIVPWGLFIVGEELHNNHHAHGSSAKFSAKWWEFDLGWFYIRVLSLLGLAKVRKLAPKPIQVPGKSRLDMEAMRAIINARFQVMAEYSRKVMSRVVRDEVKVHGDSAARRILRRARRLLPRSDLLLNESHRRELAMALSQSERLRVVYDFKKRLGALWNQTASSQEQLLHAVQDWCRQAEATGIRALQDFAQRLRGYALMPPQAAGA